uniref:Uncharacterized protein n=1 Tax=Anguilla anguilla TaxID=7936 RepID=A0A0E9PLQ8_ANGAN
MCEREKKISSVNPFKLFKKIRGGKSPGAVEEC